MKNLKIEFKWAVVFVLAQLFWAYFEKAIGLHDEHIAKHLIYTNLFAIVAIVIFILALKDKKMNFFNGTMSWRQGFISGIIISAIVALFAPLTQYITSSYITPDYFANIIAYSVENTKMTQKNAAAFFNLKSYMLQSTFFALTIGVVTAAIVAYFLKSKNTIS